jgi:hypothetical protein
MECELFESSLEIKAYCRTSGPYNSNSKSMNGGRDN